MNIWNYDIFVWHPPTLDTCPNFLPTHLLDRCLKICRFFWRLPLGNFPKTFVKIKPLKPCQDSQFPLWPFRESLRTLRLSMAKVKSRKLHRKFLQNQTTGSITIKLAGISTQLKQGREPSFIQLLIRCTCSLHILDIKYQSIFSDFR